MPQKRNPYSLSIIRGASGVLIGRMSGFLAVVKSPSARSDNLIFAYGEIPRALDFAVRVSALTTGVVRTLSVNAERMWSGLERGFSQATDLAEYVMVAAGIDYRTAYRIVGQAVRAASLQGLTGLDINPAALDEAAKQICGRPLNLEEAELAKALDPRQIVATRQAQGGAAPAEVKAMAKSFAAQANQLKTQAQQAKTHFAQTEKHLITQAESLIPK